MFLSGDCNRLLNGSIGVLIILLLSTNDRFPRIFLGKRIIPMVDCLTDWLIKVKPYRHHLHTDFVLVTRSFFFPPFTISFFSCGRHTSPAVSVQSKEPALRCLVYIEIRSYYTGISFWFLIVIENIVDRRKSNAGNLANKTKQENPVSEENNWFYTELPLAAKQPQQQRQHLQQNTPLKTPVVVCCLFGFFSFQFWTPPRAVNTLIDSGGCLLLSLLIH